MEEEKTKLETKAEEKVPVDFRTYLVEPHDVKSREVKDSDIPRVIEDSKILYNLCYTQFDRFAGAYAMAHPQITKEDPLRLFVTASGELMINPVIENHTRHTVDSNEGCISFHHMPQKKVERYHRMEVSYITLNKETTGFTERRKIDVSGRDSFVFAHEIDHLNGIYIWPMEYSRENMLKKAKEIKDIEKIPDDTQIGGVDFTKVEENLTESPTRV